MLGNFFMLTCPYLYIYETIAYFALLRNRNTAQAVDAIHTTAQVVMDVYRNRGTLYLQPLKVYKRNSETMYMLHAWEQDRFVPVRKSVVNAEILSSAPQRWLDFTIQRDVWSRMFMLAQDLLHRARRGKPRPRAEKYVLRRLLRMMVTRDERLLKLAEMNLDLADLIEIGKRMIGTGMIGGKSAGMVISRAGLSQASPRWKDILESHDSFFVGSHVFYTYLIRNGCWAAYRETRKPGMNGDSLREARHAWLNGTFPEDIQEQFKEDANYFGQTPIIVRSSSLLEDAYGNAFSGKYNMLLPGQSGHARGASGGLHRGGAQGVHQHHEQGRPHVPRTLEPARQGGADGPAGAARLRRGLRNLLLPPCGGRGVFLQPLCLEHGHRPQERLPPHGLRTGHPRGGPHR
jgi:hypothetical protein